MSDHPASASAIPEPIAAGLSATIPKAESFGIWSYNIRTRELRLSDRAAELLALTTSSVADVSACLAHVAPEDRERLAALLQRATGLSAGVADSGCTFRVSTPRHGIRWIRLSSLPDTSPGRELNNGFLADITPVKLVEMRERFIFRFAQLLIGTDTIDGAITKILPMVCTSLGWDWGAYWTPDSGQRNVMLCRHTWHDGRFELAKFSAASMRFPIPIGQGLVGKVWNTAESMWVEDMPCNSMFLRQNGARESGLHSGYAFPVLHTTPEGFEQRFGVMEFFSKLPRQPSAQLPLVATAVGALFAQTVQRLEQETAMRRMAQTDEMTGLANRSHFHERVEAACRQAAADGSGFGLLYVDLDRFKPINDAFGHEAGNIVLKAFAARLAELVPNGSVAARLGGDEFCILLHAQDIPATAHALGEAILLAARTPVLFNGWPLTVTASVGVSVYPVDGQAAPELLRNADAAMYRSKHGGRNCINFSDGRPLQVSAQSKSALVKQMTIAAELHLALQNDEFFLEYQPIADAVTGLAVAFEALIRWRRRDGDVVYPAHFIPVAEECGVIADIDRWVVKRACRDLARFSRAASHEIRVTVNMAAAGFACPSLPDDLRAIVRDAGVLPSQLCLELTEGMMMTQPVEALAVMRDLRADGFRISLDDFGTGYSSLSRLQDLPITTLKIDRSFIKGFPEHAHDRAIVRAIVELGRELELLVVVEGVEHARQLEALREMGNPLVQGYFIGRPVRLEEALEFARKSQPSPVHRCLPELV